MPFISCPSSKNPLRCLPPELRVMVYNTTLLQPVDEMDEKLLVKDAKEYVNSPPTLSELLLLPLRAPEFGSAQPLSIAHELHFSILIPSSAPVLTAKSTTGSHCNYPPKPSTQPPSF
jgi:hypothetical protein